MIGLYGVIGIVLAIGSTWGFLVLGDEVPEQGWMARLDLFVNAWVQARVTERGESIFVVITAFGAPILAVVAVLLFAYLLYERRWKRAWFFAATAGGGMLLNVLLKTIFHRVRPESAAEFHQVSWSFPSGHAMTSIIVYSLVAQWAARDYPAYRREIWTAAVALIAIIGFSRVYLGVHYISDVVAGYSAGFVWLVACVTAARVAVYGKAVTSAPAP